MRKDIKKKKTSTTINRININIFLIFVIFSCLSFSMCNHTQEQGVLRTETYKDGVQKRKGVLINNKKEGYWVSFYPSGELENESVYVNGRLNGPIYSYFKNGIIRYFGYMQNNNREGYWVDYFDNGNIRSKGKFKKGKPDGTWEYYIENGKLDKKILYKGEISKVIWDNHLTPPPPPLIPN